MANIFLSYARDDGAKAGRIAKAIEAAGHSVWWDRHIGTGSRFSTEIDEALRKAELVVVLWSASSIRSAWVLDEAAVGRDSGRLVPVLIEDVLPPLGFRQFQALPLTGGLRGALSIQALLNAVAARVKTGQPAQPATTARKARMTLPRWAMIAVVALALVALTYVLVGRVEREGGATTIAVAAAEGGDAARSREFARSVAADLGRIRSGPAAALSIVDGDSDAARKADYRIKVGLNGSGEDLRANVSLESPKDARLLWSSVIEGRGRQLVDIRQQAVSQVGDVLRCMTDLRPSSGAPSPEAEGLYLSGCTSEQPNEEAISSLRRATQLAPEFGPAWARLALLEWRSMVEGAPGDRPALIRSAGKHIDRAKAIAPNLPETIAADAVMRRADADRVPSALQILERGIRLHPDSATLRILRAEYLLDAGRNQEGIADARRANQLTPLSNSTRDSFIATLAYAGRSDEAFEELEKTESIFPGSEALQEVRYRLALRFGDPREALRLLPSHSAGTSASDPADLAWRDFLEARADPSPAKVEAALASFRARHQADRSDVFGYLQALGTFDRIDEGYRAVATPEAISSLFAGTHVLFRPYMAKFRADRRFIALTAKLGLLAYWRKTGIWPDFCRDPKLPYDCAKEAAKLTPEQLKPVVPIS